MNALQIVARRVGLEKDPELQAFKTFIDRQIKSGTTKREAFETVITAVSFDYMSRTKLRDLLAKHRIFMSDAFNGSGTVAALNIMFNAVKISKLIQYKRLIQDGTCIFFMYHSSISDVFDRIFELATQDPDVAKIMNDKIRNVLQLGEDA